MITRLISLDRDAPKSSGLIASFALDRGEKIPQFTKRVNSGNRKYYISYDRFASFLMIVSYQKLSGVQSWIGKNR